MSGGPLDSIGAGIGDFLISVLSLIGLGLGGGQAAAIADLNAISQEAWNMLPNRVLPPTTLAEGVVKGVIGEGRGLEEAAFSGVDHDRFREMVAVTGNPPGPETALTMLRRRIIDRGGFEHALKQGYLKDEWIGSYAELFYDPITVGEAVQAAVQNHLPYGEAQARAELQGVRPADFDVLFANAGNPPGPVQLLNLWVRGYIDEATVDQGLRESRLKDKWIEPLKKLAVRKVPMRTITTLLSHGAIDDARALRMLKELGYSDDDAAAIIVAGHKTATTAHKDVSVTQIRSLYADQVLPRADAHAELVRLGYTDQTADELLTLADAEADRKLRTATISKLHTLFVAHHLDAATVSQRLDELLVPSGQRDRMIALWSLEEEANVRELTEAQVIAATKRQVITVEDAMARLVKMGFNETDAIIIGMTTGILDGNGNPTTFK